MNPRTPYGVRLGYVQNKIFSVRLKSTHSIRSATCCRKSGGSTYQHLNPRTPYGVRPLKKVILSVAPTDLNPRTPYGVRQQFCIKNIAFLYRLHLFFGQIVCPKKILLFFQRVCSFYQVRISQGFHVHFPFALHKYRIT